MVKHGDFTELASSYHNRPGYSEVVLTVLGKYVGALGDKDFKVADVGAGTGKLTENLVDLGFNVVAVEPNDAMRAEGIKATSERGVKWFKGTGEETGLPSSSANWLLMGSSFHWTDPAKSLPEFSRVLKEGGFFTAIWNPRDLGRSELHTRIEEKVKSLAPNVNRVSSGAAAFTSDLFSKLVSTGHFADVVFVEAEHEVAMSKERYLGAWRSVNDIQAQAGEKAFQEIMKTIEAEITGMDEIVVPYKTRSWTAKRIR